MTSVETYFDLGPYSRYVKRNPESGQSLEGVLQLPPADRPLAPGD